MYTTLGSIDWDTIDDAPSLCKIMRSMGISIKLEKLKKKLSNTDGKHTTV